MEQLKLVAEKLQADASASAKALEAENAENEENMENEENEETDDAKASDPEKRELFLPFSFTICVIHILMYLFIMV